MTVATKFFCDRCEVEVAKLDDLEALTIGPRGSYSREEPKIRLRAEVCKGCVTAILLSFPKAPQ